MTSSIFSLYLHLQLVVSSQSQDPRGSGTWNEPSVNNSPRALSWDIADPGGDPKLLLWPELPSRLLLFPYSEPAWEYNCIADSTQ